VSVRAQTAPPCATHGGSRAASDIRRHTSVAGSRTSRASRRCRGRATRLGNPCG
jgi:hypothetical protein